jgi:hypothetical protein
MPRIKSLILCPTVVGILLMIAPHAAADGAKSKSTAWQSSLACTIMPVVGGIALLSSGDVNGPARTAAGLGLGSLGLLCGPGVGHLYAKNGRSFAEGAIIRGVGGAVLVYSASKFEFNVFGNSDHDNSLQTLGILLGAAAVVGSAIHDIRTSTSSVEQYNQRHGFSQIELRPCYFGKSEAAGLLLGMRF